MIRPTLNETSDRLMTSERILVTGGAGAIGSRLVRKLTPQHQIMVLDDLSSGFIENLRDLPIRFWRGSVVDDEILREVFAAKPTVVFHLAANFANQNSVDYPQKDLLVNGMGTLKVLQHSTDVGVKRFIYSSSSCVYGEGMGMVPLSESIREFSLDTPYAVTKLLGEQYVRFFHEHQQLPTVILRFFNSYGPGEYPGKYRNVIPNFMYRALTGQPLIVTGTGEETRDFTFIGDTVEALQLAMDAPAAIGGTFNIGSGTETRVRELAEMILDVCGVPRSIEYRPRRGWDGVNRRCADISRAKSVLQYAPSIDLRSGLTETYRWFVDHQVAQRPMF
jgi:UDP-glucose 4-epimerase